MRNKNLSANMVQIFLEKSLKLNSPLKSAIYPNIFPRKKNVFNINQTGIDKQNKWHHKNYLRKNWVLKFFTIFDQSLPEDTETQQTWRFSVNFHAISTWINRSNFTQIYFIA